MPAMLEPTPQSFRRLFDHLSVHAHGRDCTDGLCIRLVVAVLVAFFIGLVVLKMSSRFPLLVSLAVVLSMHAVTLLCSVKTAPRVTP